MAILTSISLVAIPSKPSLQIQTLLQQPPPSSSSSLQSEDSLTLVGPAQGVTLVNSDRKAPGDSVSSALVLSEMAFRGELEWESDVDVGSRRKRKKKRRGSSVNFLDSDVSSCGVGWGSIRQARSWYLSSREEAECSFYIKEGARIEATRSRIREIRKQDPTMCQWAKAVGMKRGSLEKLLLRIRESKDRVTRSYRRLVVSIAIPHLGKGLSLCDLVQEGSIGLIRGAERFDHTKGNKLSTFVYWWIKQAILRAVATKSRIVRLPGSMCGPVAKVAEAKTILTGRLGRSPTLEEIGEIVDMGISTVRLVSERTRLPMSLDQPMCGRGSITVKDIIPGPEELTPDAMVARQRMKQDIGRFLKTLTDREERILRLYFGLNGETAKSCEEIGRLLNLSRERVRQIRYIALTKLQQASKIGDLRVYIM